MGTWQLDRVGTVYRKRSRETDFGETDDAAVEVCKIWFKLVPLKLAEQREAEQMGSHVTHRIITRIQPKAIYGQDWLIASGKRYEFIAVTALAGYYEYLNIEAIEEAIHDGVTVP